MDRYAAAQMTCPIMSRPIMTPDDRTGRVLHHHVMCNADRCPMWIGDHQRGRCGLTNVNDAEAMAIRLGGSVNQIV